MIVYKGETAKYLLDTMIKFWKNEEEMSNDEKTALLNFWTNTVACVQTQVRTSLPKNVHTNYDSVITVSDEAFALYLIRIYGEEDGDTKETERARAIRLELEAKKKEELANARKSLGQIGFVDTKDKTPVKAGHATGDDTSHLSKSGNGKDENEEARREEDGSVVTSGSPSKKNTSTDQRDGGVQ